MNEKGEETIMAFVHLHTHTEYSLLDGSNKIKEYVSRVKELGMNSAAITDHGNMYGVVEFYKTAKAADINPVIGCEIYVAPNSRFDRETSHGEDRYYHLILLAENNTGYANLMKIVSIGFTEGYYYRPRVDFETLQKYHEGLICLSACLAGEVPRYIVRGFYEEAKGIAKKYQDCFGKDNYFLELQDHGIPDQKTVNQGLLRISQELDIPLVCTNDIHYTYETDVEAHDVLLCIQTGKKITDEDRMRYEGGQFFVKSEEQMRSLFPYAKEAADNTQKIADRCHVTLEFGNYQIPKYAPPEGYDSAWTFLDALCEKGFKEKYTDNPAYDETQCAKIHDDMEYELGIIIQMDFPGYFLIVSDFIQWSKAHGIPVGPGRGSGAGSVVAWSLTITDLDPLRFNLLFERFLNPERVSMPDFDVDFCQDRRGETIEYVRHKYGLGSVAQIITFGKLQAKAVIRDVGRVLQMNYSAVDRLSKLVPNTIGITLNEAFELEPEFKKQRLADPQVDLLMDIAVKLEGLYRNASTHAAGVVVGQRPLDQILPVYRDPSSDMPVTQYNMKFVESTGLVKFDFLGLKTLTVIAEAVKMV